MDLLVCASLCNLQRPSEEVAMRMREWANVAWTLLESQLTEEEFSEYRAALVAKLRERPKSLGEEFGRNWGEVTARTFAFGQREAQAAHLESLKLADLQRFTTEYIRRAPALCVLVSSSTADIAPQGEISYDRSWTPEDVAAFRRDACWRYRPVDIDRSVDPVSKI